MIIEVNGVSLYVEDHGEGTPVLLIHGLPDSARLWRHQIPFLTGHGFRAIAPDMRGFGRSGRPPEVADYALANAVGDVAGMLGIEAAHVVGHDWGAAVAWLTATFVPDRVNKLAVLSVGHPRAPRTLRQDEMAWYQLFFQFEGIAEATLRYEDWAWLRRFSRGDGDQLVVAGGGAQSSLFGVARRSRVVTEWCLRRGYRTRTPLPRRQQLAYLGLTDGWIPDPNRPVTVGAGQQLLARPPAPRAPSERRWPFRTAPGCPAVLLGRACRARV
jgi:pimeloyl-ACP methyl ester carboxylesterase